MARRQTKTDWRVVCVGLGLFIVIYNVALWTLPNRWTDGWGTEILVSVVSAMLAGLLTAVILNAWDHRHHHQDS